MQARCLLALTIGVAVVGFSAAADWPQWRGPNRDDVSRETGLLATWPKEGPKLLWTCTDAGIGYSCPSVVGDRLYTMGCRGATEYVLAFEVGTGKQAWAAKVGPRFDNGWGDGPRSTPSVDGDFVYALGGQGNLICVAAATGAEKWRLSMERDLKGEMMSSWGYAESVLIDGDKLICSPGGSQGTFAALNKKDGKVLWRSKGLTDAAAYSSIVITTVGGVKQYVNMTRNGVVGVSAEDGKPLWKSPLGANGTAVIPTPVVYKNQIYVTSGYGAGCGLIELAAASGGVEAKKVYASNEMENQHGGVVLLDGFIYGFTDRGGKWLCQEIETGKNVWDSNKLGKGSVTYADGHLYCYGQDNGTVVLARATSKGWKEDGRFTIPQKTKINRRRGQIWTHPVVANGRLYLRDQDLIFCFDLRAK